MAKAQAFATRAALAEDFRTGGVWGSHCDEAAVRAARPPPPPLESGPPGVTSGILRTNPVACLLVCDTALLLAEAKALVFSLSL